MSADSQAPPAQAHSGASSPRMGLRERKKERTRRTIRTVAMRLFREQGYAETTVEQIAEAADISPSTFFRYFPSKEQVVLADDLDPILIRAVEAQPPELSPLEALERGVFEVFDALGSEEFEFERQRTRLVYGVPELRGVVIQETERNIAMIADLVARRTGHAADSLEVRAFAGAMIGAMMTVIDDGELDLDRLKRVVAFLKAGMPL
ncbi:TetR family transcriptional regulator [Nocardia terpenica]